MKYTIYLCALIAFSPVHANGDDPSCKESLITVAVASCLLGAACATALVHYLTSNKLARHMRENSRRLERLEHLEDLILARNAVEGAQQRQQEQPPAYQYSPQQEQEQIAIARPQNTIQQRSTHRARGRGNGRIMPLPPRVRIGSTDHQQPSTPSDSLSPVDATTPTSPTRTYRTAEESRRLLSGMRTPSSSSSTPTTTTIATLEETNFGRPDATVVDVHRLSNVSDESDE